MHYLIEKVWLFHEVLKGWIVFCSYVLLKICIEEWYISGLGGFDRVSNASTTISKNGFILLKK